MLQIVFQYLVDLNKARIIALPKSAVSPSPVILPPRQHGNAAPILPTQAMGADALQILQEFAPDSYVPMAQPDMPSIEILQACQQGANLARAVVVWLQNLRWPVMGHDFKVDKSDWGISWIELFYDFHAFSGMFFPVRVQGIGKSSQYITFDDPSLQLLPPNKRSPAFQAFCLQKIISNLHTLSGHKYIPEFKSKACSSLNHLHLHGKTTGIPCRPVLCVPAVSMKLVWDYFQITNHHIAMNHAMCHQTVEPQWAEEPLPELCIEDRHKSYLKLAKRISRHKAGS
eukprot:Skav231451  [mRNA]  locus=scaffold1847:557247:558101:- [translate_table: standard]